MNTDRELLQDAAKAAGLPHQWCEAWNTMAKPRPDGGFFFERVWNPLTDDGDALRLLVRLMSKTVNMSIGFDAVSVAQVFSSTKATLLAAEDASADPLAATRRAIVRAAAEIGRSMK